jgi:hypothetical protein
MTINLNPVNPVNPGLALPNLPHVAHPLPTNLLATICLTAYKNTGTSNQPVWAMLEELKIPNQAWPPSPNEQNHLLFDLINPENTGLTVTKCKNDPPPSHIFFSPENLKNLLQYVDGSSTPLDEYKKQQLQKLRQLPTGLNLELKRTTPSDDGFILEYQATPALLKRTDGSSEYGKPPAFALNITRSFKNEQGSLKVKIDLHFYQQKIEKGCRSKVLIASIKFLNEKAAFNDLQILLDQLNINYSKDESQTTREVTHPILADRIINITKPAQSIPTNVRRLSSFFNHDGKLTFKRLPPDFGMASSRASFETDDRRFQVSLVVTNNLVQANLAHMARQANPTNPVAPAEGRIGAARRVMNRRHPVDLTQQD